LGTKLIETKTGALEAGSHTIKLNTTSLSAGNYLVEIVDQMGVRKVISMEKAQ
jgi:hypothetical protein